MSWIKDIESIVEDEIQEAFDRGFADGVSETETNTQITINELEAQVETLKEELEELKEVYELLQNDFEEYKKDVIEE